MTESVPLARLHVGHVTAFDARRGWGTVTDAQGQAFDFHATAIADGTRRIGLGVAVSFLVAPGHRGRDEARALTGVGSLRDDAPGP